MLSLLLSVMLGLLCVNVVQSLGLNELVDLGGGEAGNELLGEGVADGLACSVSVKLLLHWDCAKLTLLALLVLEVLHGLEGGASGDNFVAESTLVVLSLVDLVALFLGVACERYQHRRAECWRGCKQGSAHRIRTS
jgi:hypothetical protein